MNLIKKESCSLGARTSNSSNPVVHPRSFSSSKHSRHRFNPVK